MATTPSLIDFVQDQLKEELVMGLKESLPDIDPVMGRLCLNSKNVTRDSIGRDWKVLHTFDATGVTGLAHAVPLRGGLGESMTQSGLLTVDGGNNSKGYSLFGGPQMTTWPSADMLPTNAFLRRTITLKKHIASCPIPITLTQMDSLPGVGSMVNSILKGFIRQINMLKLNNFWKLNSDGRIATGTMAAGVTTVGTTARVLTLTGGRIANLYPGMVVVPRNDATAAETGESQTEPVFINSVDYRAKTITIVKPSGTQLSSMDDGGTVILYRYRADHVTNPSFTTTNYDMSGLEDWLVDDATSTVYGIPFASFQQFRSWKSSSYSGALDSSALNKMFGGFMEAYGSDAVDTIVTTDGVWLGFVDNIESTQQLLRYESQGQATNFVAGTKGKLKYLFNGKELEVIQTKHCPTGTVYGLKLGSGNVKMYIPPALPKAGTQAGHSQEVEFIGKAIGYPSNIVPLPSSATSTLTTDGTHLPAQFYCEVVPDQLQGIKMSTFSENI